MTQVISFATFVADLARQMGMPLDPAPGLVRLDLNGVPFMFAHDSDQWGEENVLLACDFGLVPQQNRSVILAALLAANRDMHGLWSPVFTLDPDTGHAVSMLALPLAGLDAGQAMQTMMKYVVAVGQWRETYFLEVEPV